MASVYKRGKVWWIKYSVDGNVVRKPLGTDNRKLAEQKRKEIEYLHATRRLALPSKTPVEPLLETYFEHQRASRKKKSAETDIGRLKRFFKDKPVKCLEDLSAGTVQEYLDGRVLRGEISQKTANEYRGALHALVEYAVKYKGFISKDPQFANPVKKVGRFRVSAGEISFSDHPGDPGGAG